MVRKAGLRKGHLARELRYVPFFILGTKLYGGKEMKERKYFDTEDAAKAKNCCTQTIRRLAQRGIIIPISGNRPYLFRRKDILNLPQPRVGHPRKNLNVTEVI